MVRAELEEKGISFAEINGTKDATKRNAAVEKFCKGSSDVLLLSVLAGGTGLTLV